MQAINEKMTEVQLDGEDPAATEHNFSRRTIFKVSPFAPVNPSAAAPHSSSVSGCASIVLCDACVCLCGMLAFVPVPLLVSSHRPESVRLTDCDGVVPPYALCGPAGDGKF